MEIEAFIQNFGFIGLFLLSVLGATILPFSNEAAVVLMAALDFNLWAIGLTATIGNVIGAWTVYWMGLLGIDRLPERYRPPEERLEQMTSLFNRYGAWILLLIGVPIIGDPICLVAGGLKMRQLPFLFWAFLGKGWRYPLILGLWTWLEKIAIQLFWG